MIFLYLGIVYLILNLILLWLSFNCMVFVTLLTRLFSCVIYLRCLVNDKPSVSFVLGKSRVVLKQQANWIISRKELEAAKLCSDLMLQAKESSRHFNCSFTFLD